MKFKSKIGWWFYLVVFGFAAITISLFYLGISIGTQSAKVMVTSMGVLFIVLFFTLIFPVLISTYYVLEVDYLYIKCGLLCSEKINYSNILSIEKTRNPASAAAPSLDRLGIEYKSDSNNRLNYVLISPKHKNEFIQELLKINPLITTAFPF